MSGLSVKIPSTPAALQELSVGTNINLKVIPAVDGSGEYVHSAFDCARAELVCTIADGDRVAVHDRLRGTHRGEVQGVAPTGREIDVDFIHLLRVVDGLIVERRGIADLATLREQLRRYGVARKPPSTSHPAPLT